jgi:hypothetical protein
MNAGLGAWRARRWFDAHEHWEDAWKETRPADRRSALKGLIQLAASLHKAERGEPTGHAKLWVKARSRLVTAARALGSLHGIDLVRVVEALPESPPGASWPAATRLLPERVFEFGALYLHGFGSSPTSPKAMAVRPALEATGLPVAAPTLADTDDFFDFTVSRSLRRARRRLFDRTLVIGSSLGGWTAALLAAADPRVVELVLLCPAFRFPERWLRPERSEELVRWRRDGQLDLEVGHGPSPQALGVGFLDDALAHDGDVHPPVRTTIFHGARDDVVPLTDVQPVVGDLPHVDLRVRDDDHALRATLPEIAAFCRERAAALREAPPAASAPGASRGPRTDDLSARPRVQRLDKQS